MVQGSEEIRALLSTPIPEVLWHYTSLDALKNIVESGTIWATDIRFLNDSKEHKHAVDLLRQEVESIDDPDIREFLIEGVHGLLSNGALSPNNMPIFVASFSGARDLLSQWRAYTDANKGISLGLDLRNARPASTFEQFQIIAPCIYEEEQKRKLIRSAIQGFLDQIKMTAENIHSKRFSLREQYGSLPEGEWNNSQIDALDEEDLRQIEKLKKAANKTILDLIPVLPLLKHPSFEEEREWRLVIHASPEKLVRSGKNKIRIGRASLVPYIDFSLPISPITNRPALTDLLIGPNPIMERSLSAAKTLLQWNGFSSIEPQPSATSFRSW